jgi:CHAT domain-containing protein
MAKSIAILRKSQFLFADWELNPLSVADIAEIKLDLAEFAFISACYTVNNQDIDLLDESLHIGGAFQLAGFPCVIGTLWQVGDEHSARVDKSVHQVMLSEGKFNIYKASSGLPFTLREMRRELLKESRFRTTDPLMWAPYVCVGV